MCGASHDLDFDQCHAFPVSKGRCAEALGLMATLCYFRRDADPPSSTTYHQRRRMGRSRAAPKSPLSIDGDYFSLFCGVGTGGGGLSMHTDNAIDWSPTRR